MSLRLGIVMDPIESVNFKKDSSLAMLLAAQRRGWRLEYMELADLFLRDGRAGARVRALEVFDDPACWHRIGDPRDIALGELDVILMRKDPPFDMEFVYATYLLERAAADGALVVNRPDSLRDANEKMFTAWFPRCCPPTLVARDAGRFAAFLAEHGDIVLKPLDGMGGASVFRVRADDPNRKVIVETLTRSGTRFAMAQRYVPAITEGDKRILLINGEPAVPYALARMPAAGDQRGNLAAGARGKGVELGDAELAICAEVGPALRERGLLFVGLDVIGDRLTEINVTSPTCIRELDAIYGCDIGGQFIDAVTGQVRAQREARGASGV